MMDAPAVEIVYELPKDIKKLQKGCSAAYEQLLDLIADLQDEEYLSQFSEEELTRLSISLCQWAQKGAEFFSEEKKEAVFSNCVRLFLSEDVEIESPYDIISVTSPEFWQNPYFYPDSLNSGKVLPCTNIFKKTGRVLSNGAHKVAKFVKENKEAIIITGIIVAGVIIGGYAIAGAIAASEAAALQQENEENLKASAPEPQPVMTQSAVPKSIFADERKSEEMKKEDLQYIVKDLGRDDAEIFLENIQSIPDSKSPLDKAAMLAFLLDKSYHAADDFAYNLVTAGVVKPMLGIDATNPKSKAGEVGIKVGNALDKSIGTTSIFKGVFDIALGVAGEGGSAALAATGIGAPAAVLTSEVSTALIAQGTVEVIGGVSLLARSSFGETSSTYVEEKEISINQINQKIQKGQAPKSIIRAESDKFSSSKIDPDHIHFDNGSALRRDGTFKHGWKKLTNEEKEFLIKNGFKIPEGQ